MYLCLRLGECLRLSRHEQVAGANLATMIVICAIFPSYKKRTLSDQAVFNRSSAWAVALERVSMALCFCELYLCYREFYLWIGIIFFKYVFFCFQTVFLSCLVVVMFLVFCSGNVSDLCLLMDYTLSSICGKFQ